MKQKKDIWKEFCYDLIEDRKNDVLEDKYQNTVESNLRQLGWSKVLGELCPKERINVGSHGQIEPDITIKINNIPVFVVELKRPNNKIPNLTFDQLSQIFPDNLQGSYGVLRTMSDIASSSQDKQDLKSRYTMSSREYILTSADGVRFVVSNQWGTYNFVNFIDHIKEMGWAVNEVRNES